MNSYRDFSISRVTQIIIVLIVFVVFIAAALFFISLYKQHKLELKEIEKSYILSQKELIKKDTHRALQYIKYKYSTKGNRSLKELQKDIVDAIEHMRDKRNGTGYIFIYSFSGVNIADPILRENRGKNLLNFKDPNGKFVIKELIDVAKRGGGYVEYVWNKPTTNKPAAKISYAAAFEPLKWMVGSGVYLDDISKVLEQKKQEYKDRIFSYIFKIFIFIAVILLLIFLIAEYFAKRVYNDIGVIKETLLGVSKNYKKIPKNRLYFKETKDVASSLNSMTEELKILNTKLENKIELRTKELEKSQKYALKLVQRQDRFLKDAVHEINTPLSIIITNIDLFKLKFGENRYLSKIEAGSKIIENIYEDLSYLIKKDRVTYKANTIDMQKFLNARVEFFREIATGNSVTIEKIYKSSCKIYINEILLQRVIDNTISNAIKYSYPKSKVRVELFKQDNSCTLEISNRGDEIKDKSSLFNRYYRENSSRGGFGLGLSIIKEICDKNGIIIELDSKESKTTFRYIWKD